MFFFLAVIMHLAPKIHTHTHLKNDPYMPLWQRSCLEPPRHMGSILLQNGWLEPSNLMKFTHILKGISSPILSFWSFCFFFPALCCMMFYLASNRLFHPVFVGKRLLGTTYVFSLCFRFSRFVCGFQLGGADRFSISPGPKRL